MKKAHCKRGHDTTLPENRYKSGRCKACRAEIDARPEVKARKAARNASPEVKARTATYNSSPEGKAKLREYNLKDLGWTTEMYNQTLLEQGGRCMICRLSPTGKTKHGGLAVLSADHNHATMQPRALLCGPCNHAIGLLKENPNTCRAAAEYLEAWRNNV